MRETRGEKGELEKSVRQEEREEERREREWSDKCGKYSEEEGDLACFWVGQ